MARLADLPSSERPRERLTTQGPAALADRELVALLLGTGTHGEGALSLADRVLELHGGIHGLSRVMMEELAAERGVGHTKAARVLVAFELARRLRFEPPVVEPLRSPEALAGLVCPRLATERREVVLVVVLDGGQRPRRVVTVSVGGLDRSLVPVREVLNAALRNDGAAFAIAHSHPSGNLAPSPLDIESTALLADSARVVGLRFVDHLIVTGSGWSSMRAAGLMPA